METINVGTSCTIRVGSDYYGDCEIFKIERKGTIIHVRRELYGCYGDHIFTKRKNKTYYELKTKCGKGKQLLIGINKSCIDPNF